MRVEVLRRHKPYRGYDVQTVRVSSNQVQYTAVYAQSPGKRTVLADDMDICRRVIDQREGAADAVQLPDLHP